uniref:Integral membrane protein, putative n=1 Tax=Theileria annulata TaxID=5874 RepID=A0A3B0MUQ5_THEAN
MRLNGYKSHVETSRTNRYSSLYHDWFMIGVGCFTYFLVGLSLTLVYVLCEMDYLMLSGLFRIQRFFSDDAYYFSKQVVIMYGVIGFIFTLLIGPIGKMSCIVWSWILTLTYLVFGTCSYLFGFTQYGKLLIISISIISLITHILMCNFIFFLFDPMTNDKPAETKSSDEKTDKAEEDNKTKSDDKDNLDETDNRSKHLNAIGPYGSLVYYRVIMFLVGFFLGSPIILFMLRISLSVDTFSEKDPIMSSVDMCRIMMLMFSISVMASIFLTLTFSNASVTDYTLMPFRMISFRRLKKTMFNFFDIELLVVVWIINPLIMTLIPYTTRIHSEFHKFTLFHRLLFALFLISIMILMHRDILYSCIRTIKLLNASIFNILYTDGYTQIKDEDLRETPISTTPYSNYTLRYSGDSVSMVPNEISIPSEVSYPYLENGWDHVENEDKKLIVRSNQILVSLQKLEHYINTGADIDIRNIYSDPELSLCKSQIDISDESEINPNDPMKSTVYLLNEYKSELISMIGSSVLGYNNQYSSVISNIQFCLSYLTFSVNLNKLFLLTSYRSVACSIVSCSNSFVDNLKLILLMIPNLYLIHGLSSFIHFVDNLISNIQYIEYLIQNMKLLISVLENFKLIESYIQYLKCVRCLICKLQSLQCKLKRFENLDCIIKNLEAFIKISCCLKCESSCIQRVQCFTNELKKINCFIDKFKCIDFEKHLRSIDCLIKNLCCLSKINIITYCFILKCSKTIRCNICILGYIKCNILSLQKLYTSLNLFQSILAFTANLQTFASVLCSFNCVDSILDDLRDIHSTMLYLGWLLTKIPKTQNMNEFICNLKLIECTLMRFKTVCCKIELIQSKISKINNQMEKTIEFNSKALECLKSLIHQLNHIKLLIQYLQAIESLINSLNYTFYIIKNLDNLLSSIIKLGILKSALKSSENIKCLVKELECLDQIINREHLTKTISCCLKYYRPIVCFFKWIKCKILRSRSSTVTFIIIPINCNVNKLQVLCAINTIMKNLHCIDTVLPCLEQIKCILHCLQPIKKVKTKLQCIYCFIINLTIIDTLIQSVMSTKNINLCLLLCDPETIILICTNSNLEQNLNLIKSLQFIKMFMIKFQHIGSIINTLESGISIFNNINCIGTIMNSLTFIESYTNILKYSNKDNIKYLELSIESVGRPFLYYSTLSTFKVLFKLTDDLIKDDLQITLSDQSVRPAILLQSVSRLSNHLNQFIWTIFSHISLEECRFVISMSYKLFKITKNIFHKLKFADSCCCVCCYRSSIIRNSCKDGDKNENTFKCGYSMQKLLQVSKTTGVNLHSLLLYDIILRDQAAHPCLCLIIKYRLTKNLKVSKCYFDDILSHFFKTSKRKFDKRTHSTRMGIDMAKFIYLIIWSTYKILILISERYRCKCDKTCCTSSNKNSCTCCNGIKIKCCSCLKPKSDCKCCCKEKGACNQSCCTTINGSSCVCCRCCCVCFCRCRDDEYYPYFISLILYVSQLILDVFTFDNEKIQTSIQNLSNMIADLELMDLNSHKLRLNNTIANSHLITSSVNTGFSIRICNNSITLTLGFLSVKHEIFLNTNIIEIYKSLASITEIKIIGPKFDLFYQFFSGLSFYIQNNSSITLETKDCLRKINLSFSDEYIFWIRERKNINKECCTENNKSTCKCCRIVCICIRLFSNKLKIIASELTETGILELMNSCFKNSELNKLATDKIRLINSSTECLIKSSKNSRISDSTSSMIYGGDFDHINPKYFGYDDVYRPHPHFGSGYFKFVLSRVFIVIILLFMFIFIRTRFDRFVKPDIFGAYLIKVDSNINRFREVLHNRLGHSIRNIVRIGSLDSLFDDIQDPRHHLVFEYPELADIHDLRSWSESDSISDTFTDAIYDEQSRTVQESRRRKVAFYLVIVVFSLLSSLYLNFVVRDLSVMLNLDHSTWSYFISITILVGMIISLVVKYCVHLYDFVYVLEKYSNRLTKIESFVDDSFGGITGNLSYTSKFLILFQLLRSLKTDIVSLFSMNYPYHIPAQSLMKNKVYPYKDMTSDMERMMTCENIECIRSMVLETIGTPESMDLQNILDFISYVAIRNTSEFDKYHGYFSGNERYLAWRLGKLLSHNFFLLTYGRYSCILEMDHIIRNLQVPITQFHNCQMLWQLFGNYESNLISIKCLAEESIGVPLTAIQRDVLKNKFNEEYIGEFNKYQEFIMRNLHINTRDDDDEAVCSCYFPYPELIKCPLDRDKVSRLTREYFGDNRRLSLSLPTTNCNVTKQSNQTKSTSSSSAVSVTKFCDHWLNMRLDYCDTEECEKAVRFAYELILSKLSSDSDIFESIKETVASLKLNILNTEEVYETPQDIHVPIKSSEHKSLKDYTNKLNELRYQTSDNYHDTVLDYLNRYMMETMTNTEKIMVPLGIFLSWYGIPICEEHIRNMGKFQYLI